MQPLNPTALVHPCSMTWNESCNEPLKRPSHAFAAHACIFLCDAMTIINLIDLACTPLLATQTHCTSERRSNRAEGKEEEWDQKNDRGEAVSRLSRTYQSASEQPPLPSQAWQIRLC